MGMINTSASGNVTVTFTKEEWLGLTRLAQSKTIAEKSGNVSNFAAEYTFGYNTDRAYIGGLADGEVLLARQIVGESA